MEIYIYFITFLLAIPLIWFILLATNLENHFKQGKIWQIRVSYVIITLIFAHLLASCFAKLVSVFQNI